MRAYRVMAVMVMAVAIPASGGSAGPPVRLTAANLPVTIETAELQRQFDALSAMPDVQVEYSIGGSIKSITGDTGLFVPAEVRDLKVGDSAQILLDMLGPVLLATGRETLWVKDEGRQVGLDIRHYLRMDQSIRGIPVFGGSVTIQYEESSGRILSVFASFLPDRNMPTAPAVSAVGASEAVVHALETSGDAVPGSVHELGKPSLSYLGLSSDSPEGRLAWGVYVSFKCPTGLQGKETVWIDAIDKLIIARHSMISYVQWPGPCQVPRSPPECKVEPDTSIRVAPDSSSCNRAVSRPQLMVERIGCSNRFRVSWPEVPGALQYQVLSTRQDLGWAFATTLAAGYVHQCTTEVNVATLVRMRPCDRCDCGQWSDVKSMDPAARCP